MQIRLGYELIYNFPDRRQLDLRVVLPHLRMLPNC
jgi:hypothetical protein